jgi:hypothetical protein
MADDSDLKSCTVRAIGVRGRRASLQVIVQFPVSSTVTVASHSLLGGHYQAAWASMNRIQFVPNQHRRCQPASASFTGAGELYQ